MHRTCTTRLEDPKCVRCKALTFVYFNDTRWLSAEPVCCGVCKLERPPHQKAAKDSAGSVALLRVAPSHARARSGM